jgi:hypothetical protein
MLQTQQLELEGFPDKDFENPEVEEQNCRNKKKHKQYEKK